MIFPHDLGEIFSNYPEELSTLIVRERLQVYWDILDEKERDCYDSKHMLKRTKDWRGLQLNRRMNSLELIYSCSFL